MAKKRVEELPIEPRIFTSADEIDRGVAKLERRIKDLEAVDMREALQRHTGADEVARSDIRETIRDVFGARSPEFDEHQHIDIWAGPLYMGMPPGEILAAKERGRTQVIGTLRGLISRLKERQEELIADGAPTSPISLTSLGLHPRLSDVAADLFVDGHHWEAVFAAAKALVNYVKERSGKHDLDGAPLMRTVFSRNGPLLAFNELKDQTDLDEQEGMMHLFEGATLAVRNPGGHAFPEGPERRAVEYLSLLSLLAYRLQEARRTKA